MAVPQLDRLKDNARIHLPSALDAAIQRELFNTLDEFCKESLIWREEIPLDVTTTETEYDVIPTSGQVMQLEWIKNPDGLYITTGSMEEPGFLVLSDEPQTAEEWTVKVILTVVDPVKTDGDPEIPDWIVTKYYLGILDGLLGRMMSHPAKPYSNERMAIYHLRRFRDAISRARADASRQNIHGAQRWTYPQNFR